MQPRKSQRHQRAANTRWRVRKADEERDQGIPDRPALVEHRQPFTLPFAALGWKDVRIEPRLGYIAWRCVDDRTGEVLACKALGEMLRWVAGQVPRDALDIATATGLRVRDVLALRMSDVRDGYLIVQAGKTQKRIEFDVAASSVLPAILERRRESKSAHVFLLDAGRYVTERMLGDRFVKARDLAAKDCPEVAGMYLRDMRKRAAQLSGSLEDASRLLQHSSTAVTRRHYRGGDRVRPVR